MRAHSSASCSSARSIDAGPVLVVVAALVGASLGLLGPGAGCTAREAGNAAPDQDPAADFGEGGCTVAADCELAGPSCCDCFGFALPVAEGFGASCEGAVCPPASDRCSALEAVCEAGTCAARCLPITCGLSCELGFAADELGCLLCLCASAPPDPECEVAGDCARVPADCCGCERGGRDTAVAADQVAAHEDSLACPAQVSCPDVNSCNQSETVICQDGRCALAEPLPPGADAGVDTGGVPPTCGSPALPPCPAGQVCVLNAPGADETTQIGLGTCASP